MLRRRGVRCGCCGTSADTWSTVLETNYPQEYSDNRYLRRVQVMAHQVEHRLRAFLDCHCSLGSVLRVAEIVRDEVRSEASRQGGKRQGQAWE